mgnify:CR=1 FL=1|jgi:hypothetical protein
MSERTDKRDREKNTERPCDYQIDLKCEKILPPGRGIWHPVTPWGSSEEINKWCCLPCEMHFDDE